jgi:hypothetical protein
MEIDRLPPANFGLNLRFSAFLRKIPEIHAGTT